MKTSEVQLVSSDGWNSVTFFMSENPIPNQDGLIQVALVSKGIFWNRRQILSISPTYESMDEFDITLLDIGENGRLNPAFSAAFFAFDDKLFEFEDAASSG